MPHHFASVLVVDDDSDIREAICGVLEAEGYTTLIAENGERALAVIDEGRRPCVVLLDLMMPVMNGWEFMKAVRGKQDLDDLPVVVCSAFTELATATATNVGDPCVAGAHHLAKRVLKKPLDVPQLLAAVAEYCCCSPHPRHVSH